MPWFNFASLIQDATWYREALHWYSQWIVFCPFLTLASTKNHAEREVAENRLLPKFLLSLAIQVTVGVASVIGGSYLTLQIVSYRMTIAEEAIKTIQTRQFKNEDRITESEAKLREIAVRHQFEQYGKNGGAGAGGSGGAGAGR